RVITGSILTTILLVGCTTESNSQPMSVISETVAKHTNTELSTTPLTFNEYITELKQQTNATAAGDLLLNNYQGQRDEQHFPLFIDYLTYRATLAGIPLAVTNRAFQQIYFLKRAIRADKNQLEKKITLKDYLQRVLSTSRYTQAKAEYKIHQPLLKQISAKTGVPGQYIIALWGLESAFGKIQGKENVIAAVATLAYEGRREEFFVKELLAALQVINKGYISPEKMKGSWAGAMGQCQFMPSSLLTYGVDGDNDGTIDIWSNTRDVFASIANYLATEGWNSTLPWGEKVQLPADFDLTLEGTAFDKQKSISEWQALGIRYTQVAKDVPLNKRDWLVVADNEPNSAYLVYDKFK